MSSPITFPTAAKANFTITLASLATNASRQSTMINNSGNRGAAIINVRIKSGGSAPTAGGVYSVYLIRGDDPSSSTFRSDGAGASDAAITIENALLIGQIVVTNNANKNFYGSFDTWAAGVGILGPEWGIAIYNGTTQNISSTGGDHLAEYLYYDPQVA